MLTSDQNGSNTAVKQSKKPNPVANSKPFTKGDPRINRNGRPRTFDAVREIAQSICHEELELKDGRKIQVVEAVLRAWAKSPEPQLQKAFIEYAFGKVPDKVDMTTEHKTKLFLNYAHDSDRGADSSDRTTRLPSGTN